MYILKIPDSKDVLQVFLTLISERRNVLIVHHLWPAPTCPRVTECPDWRSIQFLHPSVYCSPAGAGVHHEAY